MQSEQDWSERADAGDDTGAAERYAYFMRPEPFEDLGPIRLVDDQYLGKDAKVRDMAVGMVRNAKDENKKHVTAYLLPFPHTRIEKAKDLQGWYKSLHEGPGVRPRPCMTEAILTEPYGGFCAVGCIFSLPAGEQVDTPHGAKSIEAFEPGDVVWGRTVVDCRQVKVLGATRHWKPEGLIELQISDGRRLRLTGDHPVYSKERGWVAAETLLFGEELEDVSMPRLRARNAQQEILQTVLAEEQSREGAETSEALQRLFETDQTLSDCLRRMQSQDSSRQREFKEGQALRESWQTEVGSYKEADERLCNEPPRRNGPAGAGSEVSRVPFGESRGRAQRQVRLQALQTSAVHGQEGENIQLPLNLGEARGHLVRRAGEELGLRTVFDPAAERLYLPTGLRAQALRSNLGNQGVHDAGGSREDSRSEGTWLQDYLNESEGTEEARHPYVVGIKRIPGAVEVFDIETESGNFYQNGILVHNCYINSGIRGYRGTGLITVPLNYGEQVKKQLTKVRRAAAGYFSSFTDPFTPLEAFYHNTEEAAREFVSVGLPIFFLSRLKYPDWAIELLKKNPHSYAQKSLNTPNPDDWRLLSPGALPLQEHMEDIRKLKRNGIYVSIQCNPIVAGVTSNEDVVKLFKMLADAGADHVIVKFVEAGYSWAPAMVERMIKRFGDRGREFERLFTENIGGQRTIVEEYRLRAHRLYQTYARMYGLTYATCYEYRKERDETGKVTNSTGISIGREFTTSEQCHGARVPMYSRTTADELFKPVAECPPTGCLYCASENDGKPRCGDELAGEAKALRLVDLKVPFGAKA